MKKFIAYCLVIASQAFIYQAAFAVNSVCSYQRDRYVCGKGKINHLFHLGNVTLSETDVGGRLSVTGDLKATSSNLSISTVIGSSILLKNTINEKIKIIGNVGAKENIFKSMVSITGDYLGKNNAYNDKVSITGDSQLSEEKFIENANITGKLKTKKTTFNKQLLVNSCKIELDRSSAEEIKVTYKRQCDQKIQIVKLINESVVNGDIAFQGGNGRVLMDKGSVIEGKVVGGKIILI